MNPLTPITIDPRAVVRIIRRHPKGISQQAVLKAVLKGYRGSDQSASYTKMFRALEDAWVTSMRLEPLSSVEVAEGAKENAKE